jgi:hypothetical protein
VSDNTIRKLKGVGKVSLGAARVIGGLMTATGHGLLGGFLRSHHMAHAAYRIGKSSLEAGGKMFRQGLEDLRGS